MSQYRLSLLFLIFFIIPPLGYPQNNIIVDSLENVLKIVSGKEKIKVLNDLCWEYKHLAPEKSIEYGNQALELSKEMKDKKGEAQSYNDLGYCYQLHGDYRKAQNYYEQAIRIRAEIGDTIGMATAMSKIGMIHKEQGNLREALDVFLKTLEIFEAKNNEYLISHTLNNVAVIYQLQSNYDFALDYFFRSLTMKEKVNDDYGKSGTYMNIGSIYHFKHNDSLAIKYDMKGLELAKKINEPNYISNALNNLGALYTDIGKYKDALVVLLESYQIRSNLDDKKGMSSNLINIGAVYRHLSDYKNSEKYLENALAIATGIGAKQEIQNSHLNLSVLYSDRKDFERALYHHQLFSQTKDSIVNEEMNAQIIEMKTKYETEKKESEIAVQQLKISEQQLKIDQRNILTLILTIGLLMLIALSVLIYRQQKLKQKQLADKMIIEQQEIHISSIIEGEQKERKRLAEDLHDGLGQMLSTVRINASGFSSSNENNEKLQKTIELIDDACDELRNISHDLMPGVLIKLGLVPALKELADNINATGKIAVHFQTHGIENRFNDSVEIALYRIIQELFNNIIKYSEAKNITLQLIKGTANLNVVLEDNGKGFDVNKIGHSDGIGWRNIRSRVQFLKGELNIDSTPGRGTTVSVDIPLNT